MKVFILYAHPEPKSYNCKLKNKAFTTLTRQGHEVKVSDLYAMEWKTVADKEDFTELESKDFLKYQVEQKKRKLTEDILEEQKKVEWADLIIVQFPFWWFGVPAIIKGWMDRVLTSGWAYSWPNIYDKGPFTKKKVLISTTTGGPDALYTDKNLNGDIIQILFPVLHSFYFCGFQILQPNLIFSPAHSEVDRKRDLKSWAARLKKISEEKPLPFSRQDEYCELTSLKKTDMDILMRKK
ncbi:nad p h oxidoreductase-related [Anaeramoeba ignava]|uniref:Nad p h oxidoreductase-related n=1 Tax=Anaeramoeba ignava TaxID=1746090 RepID=A0A9Q0R531_ANAIG|nr:nad p h oxidoreductase-related [Anaeramoeba ignava]